MQEHSLTAARPKTEDSESHSGNPADSSTLPLLVIVAGPPASGKTTLARRLSNSLQLPLICRDPITEALAEALQPRSPQDMGPITQASFRVFYGLITDHLNRGTGMVCETNFHRGVAEAELRPIVALARAVVVHCQVGRELSMRRFIERFERGERHWCYFDGERLAEIKAGRGMEAWDEAEPLDLDVPLVTVDTTDGYEPDADEIAHFALGSASTLDRPAPNESVAANPSAGPDATVTSPVHACPSLGFVDEPTSHYSHPTHLHRCYAGVSPLRLSTQQQRELCLTDGFVSCPRLGGAYPAKPTPVATAAAPRLATPAYVRTNREPAQSSAGPEPKTEDQAPPLPVMRRSARAGSIVRGIVAGIGLAIGVAATAILLFAMFSGNRPDYTQDEISRLAVGAPTSVRFTTARDVGQPPSAREADAIDASVSTAGIQQVAPPIVESEPTSAPTPAPTIAPQTEAVAPSPVVRRATIRAPQGFTGALLRDAPRTSALSLRTLSNGTPIEVLEGTAAGDGFTWARVRTQDGTTGWMVSTALGGG